MNEKLDQSEPRRRGWMCQRNQTECRAFTWCVELRHDPDAPESRVLDDLSHVCLRVHMIVWVVRSL